MWAADLKTLYRSVDLDALPEGRAKRRTRKRAALVEAASGGDSVFTLYLAVDIEPAWFAAKSNGHFFYTPTRKGVGRGVYRELEAILADAASGGDASFRDSARRWISALHWHHHVRDLHSRTQGCLAGTHRHDGTYHQRALRLCALRSGARARGWYDELKTFTEDCLMRSLEDTIYPGLRGAVRDRFSYSPLSIARNIGSAAGAITGWAFPPPVPPAVHRMQEVARSVLTDLQDVYQAGQWAYSPSGLPIAILTGKLAADRAAKGLPRPGARARRGRPGVPGSA